MVKRWLAFLALSSLLTFLLLACAPAASGTIRTAPPAASGTEVHMNNTNFVQPEITLQKGQSVRLINDDPYDPSRYESDCHSPMK